MVKKLPWGWVKESMERIKVFGSFPKEYSTAQMMGMPYKADDGVGESGA